MFNEWYLCRNKDCSGEEWVQGYPVEWTGIEKAKGCVYYKPTDKSCLLGSSNAQMAFYLSPKTCKAKFGHCPKEGELLYVKKTRKGWKSEKIELEFSE